MKTWDELRELRIEHDRINGKRIGALTPREEAILGALRSQLHGTEFAPWSTTQTKEAYESIYGEGTWKPST